MDYRDANAIERDRVSHYNRQFGSCAPRRPLKKRVETETKRHDVYNQKGSHHLTQDQLKELDLVING